MPRVSGIDDAYCISVHLMFLSNCVVQIMRVWSLPALLSLLAKHDTPRREGTLAGSAQIHVASMSQCLGLVVKTEIPGAAAR